MTTLSFPESGEDLSDAFNNALLQGELNDDQKSTLFWPKYELLASIVENGVKVADQFREMNTSAFVRVSRSTEEIER